MIKEEKMESICDAVLGRYGGFDPCFELLGGAMGPILEFVVLEGVMERLFLWSLRRQFTEDMKLEQLRMYQMLLSQARQPLLHHKPVLRPLMTLLASCAGTGTGELCDDI